MGAEANRLDSDRKRVNDTANELFRIAAVRRQEAARTAREEKKTITDEAKREARAWEAVEPLAERTETLRQADSVRQQIAQEDRETAPLRAQRDSAAAALRARYTTLAEAEYASQELELQAAVEAVLRAEAEDLLAQNNRDSATKAGGLVEQLGGQLIQIDIAVDEAVKRGDLPDREADTGIVLAGMRKRHRESKAELDAVRARRSLRPSQRTTLEQQRRASATEIGAKTVERDQLVGDHAELAGRIDAFVTHPRLAELVQLDDGGRLDLWAEGPDLRAALAHAVSSAESATIDTRVDAAEDDRALDGLRADAFLPTTRDAQRVVDVIAASGIAARPGWELLRDLVTESERAPRAVQRGRRRTRGRGGRSGGRPRNGARCGGSGRVAFRRAVTLCSAAQLQRALSMVRPDWHVVPSESARH